MRISQFGRIYIENRNPKILIHLIYLYYILLILFNCIYQENKIFCSQKEGFDFLLHKNNFEPNTYERNISSNSVSPLKIIIWSKGKTLTLIIVIFILFMTSAASGLWTGSIAIDLSITTFNNLNRETLIWGFCSFEYSDRLRNIIVKILSLKKHVNSYFMPH